MSSEMKTHTCVGCERECPRSKWPDRKHPAKWVLATLQQLGLFDDGQAREAYFDANLIYARLVHSVFILCFSMALLSLTWAECCCVTADLATMTGMNFGLISRA